MTSGVSGRRLAKSRVQWKGFLSNSRRPSVELIITVHGAVADGTDGTDGTDGKNRAGGSGRSRTTGVAVEGDVTADTAIAATRADEITADKPRWRRTLPYKGAVLLGSSWFFLGSALP
jgi:hypothetical protein